MDKREYFVLSWYNRDLLALPMIIIMTFGSYYSDAGKNTVTIGSMTVAQGARRIKDAMSTDINVLLMSSYAVDSMLTRGDSTPEFFEYVYLFCSFFN